MTDKLREALERILRRIELDKHVQVCGVDSDQSKVSELYRMPSIEDIARAALDAPSAGPVAWLKFCTTNSSMPDETIPAKRPWVCNYWSGPKRPEGIEESAQFYWRPVYLHAPLQQPQEGWVSLAIIRAASPPEAHGADKRSAPAVFHNVECKQCGANVQKMRADIQDDDAVVFGQHAAPAVSGEAVAWGIFDSQGFYEASPSEEAARRFCDHYNQRPVDPLKPYSVAPLYAHPTGEIEKDAARLDWLCRQFVTVRIPMRYGSRECFMGSPDDNDDESLPWDIRAAIDAAMNTEAKNG